jgi:amino-acid N-acetyltransferase
MGLKLQYDVLAPMIGVADHTLGVTPSTWPIAVPTIRRAFPGDVPALLELLDRYARLGLVLTRTPAELYRNFRECFVAIDDGLIVGCAGLRIYHQTLAEVVAVAVAEGRQGQGIGRRVVGAVLEEARLLSLRRVFALTMRESFFRQFGFHDVELTEIPEKLEADRAEEIDRSACMKTAMVLNLAP